MYLLATVGPVTVRGMRILSGNEGYLGYFHLSHAFSRDRCSLSVMASLSRVQRSGRATPPHSSSAVSSTSLWLLVDARTLVCESRSS